MGWTIVGGQAIVDLRLLWLSGVWQQATQAYWEAKTLPQEDTIHGSAPKRPKKAA